MHQRREDEALLYVFDQIIFHGSVKFGAVLGFNDPFEFKFRTVPPTRREFDEWHLKNGPHRTSAELENAWNALTGPAASWNATIAPRQTLLNNLFAMCLTRRWNSHLMWSHYASMHCGFVVVYKPEVIQELSSFPNHAAHGDVIYAPEPPQLRWFNTSTEEMIAPLLSTKPSEWSYEEEYRVIMHGDPSEREIFSRVAPELISGVILGARASEKLRLKSLAAKDHRTDFTVRAVSSDFDSYNLTTYDIDGRSRRATHTL